MDGSIAPEEQLVGGRRERRAARYVYFVQAEAVRLIKIGIAVDPRQRLFALQTGSPDRLSLLGVIAPANPAKTELDLHAAFHAERRHGEWFGPSAPLLEFIERHVRAPEEVHGDQMRAWARTKSGEESGLVPVTVRCGIHTIDVGHILLPSEKPRPSERVSKRPKERLAAYKATRGIS